MAERLPVSMSFAWMIPEGANTSVLPSGAKVGRRVSGSTVSRA